jgi:hypothetical protein
MVFEFRYTAMSFGGTSESAAELTVTLRNGAHTTMVRHIISHQYT